MKKNKKNYERMVKTRRRMAMLGVLIIAFLYIYFFFLTLMDLPGKTTVLFAAFASTIIVPVIMYALSMLAKNLADYSGEDAKNDETKNPDAPKDSISSDCPNSDIK